MINQEYILNLIASGEGERLDFKEAITSREKIAKTLVAFANTKGGTLLVGVKDNGRIRGVDTVEESEMLLWASEHYTKPIVELEFTSVSVNGKQVLVVGVEKSENRPHYSKDDIGKYWAYLRSKDQTLKASKIMLEVMKSDKKGKQAKIIYGDAEKKMLELVEQNSEVTIKQFCKAAKVSRRKATGILVNMLRMGLINVLNHEKEDYFIL